MTGAPLNPTRLIAYALLVSLPLAGFLLLLAAPDLDVRWEHQPSHFWLVLAAAATNAVLAYATGDAARRRGDARVFLVSLAFLASAGFLLLHALATPRVLLEGSNAGFVIATPVGLTISAGLLAGSAAGIEGARAAGIMRAMSRVRLVLIAILVAWAVVSLAELPPLSGEPPLQRGSFGMVGLATVAILCFGAAAVGYFRLYLRRPSRLVGSVITASVLLAQAMVAVAFSRNWHASWWEWHVLMLVAFALVALSARSQWRDERFTDLYLEDTAAGTREVSVIFADLEGFTSFSENHEPREVSEMLNAVFEVAVPAVVGEQGGEVNQISGDAIMGTFNTRGDQPDHALRATRAALTLRDAVASLGRQHPDWPRLRIGVNSGEALVGVVGTRGGRTYTVVGDMVNLAARLEQSAPAGGVVIGAQTLARVPEARVQHLGALKVKGKDETVEAYLLVGFDKPTSTPR